MVASFTAAQTKGLSVAAWQRSSRSIPPVAKGGAYGCYAPTSTSYASVRTDVANDALNSFPTTPLSVSQNGTTYALYVAPTKRSATTFSVRSSAVLTDLAQSERQFGQHH